MTPLERAQLGKLLQELVQSNLSLAKFIEKEITDETILLKGLTLIGTMDLKPAKELLTKLLDMPRCPTCDHAVRQMSSHLKTCNPGPYEPRFGDVPPVQAAVALEQAPLIPLIHLRCADCGQTSSGDSKEFYIGFFDHGHRCSCGQPMTLDPNHVHDRAAMIAQRNLYRAS